MVRRIVFFIALTTIWTRIDAQNAASPYSLFGIGLLSGDGLTYQEGMGGLGISNGKYWVLNNVNPALLPMNSFTTFDLGLYTERRNLTTSDLSQSNTTGGLRHLTLGIPIINLKWSIALGLMPYSNVSYNMTTSSPVVNWENATANYKYIGSGGLNQVYLSSGYQIIPKLLSVGFKAGYAFGTVTDETHISIEEIIYEDEEDEIGTAKLFEPSRYFRESRYSDFLFQGGINLKKEIKKNMEVSLGFIYEFETDMNTARKELVEIYNPSDPKTPTDEVLSDAKGSTYLPPNYGFGLSFTKMNKWTFGIDYYMRDWTKYKSDFGGNDPFTNSYKIIVGGELTPDITSVTSYMKRVTYLFGFNIEQTPILINNTNIDDFGINFGVSLPVGNASIFNLALKYGQLGTTSNGLIREDYVKINLGMTFNDRSFGWYRNQNKFK